jgi:hypothetical protein
MTDSTEPGSTDPGEIRDSLPDDLNAAEYVGAYLFPDNKRRRIPGLLYIASGVLMVLGWLLRHGHHPILVGRGVGLAGILFILLGVYHLCAGVHLNVQDIDALTAASGAVGFPVGHASAQLGWRGLLSRPTWRILLYSAEDPPKKRGLVLVDGVDASIIGQIVHDNPEDWSAFGT